MTSPSERTEKLWRCECGQTHFISLTCDPVWEEVGAHGYISIIDVYALPRRPWYERLRAAWQVFRGCRYDATEVLLTAETAREMRDELERILATGQPKEVG